MANAVLVERITATVGNAVLVQSLAAAASPSAGNAVLVQSVKATVAAPTGNAVLVQSLKSAISGGPPTANAGPDQSVEPWATVTLTGAASTAVGTVTGYAWTQTSGPAVTLVGTGSTRTFTAPASAAGATLVFSLVVTDNTGLVSTADTVTVTALPATEFYATAGAWVPYQNLTSW